jgi:hypothetical protein
MLPGEVYVCYKLRRLLWDYSATFPIAPLSKWTPGLLYNKNALGELTTT